MIDFKFMEALVAVITEGGFEKASKVLHITQSAISQRIKQLEEMTGQILIVRSAPPVPTEAGKRIVKYFMQVRQLEHELFDNLSQSSDRQFLNFPIGINADTLATWFLDVVIPFLENERVTIDIRVDDQEQTHRMLKDGEVFGCISSKKVTVQGCRSQLIGYMNYRMVAAPGFKKRWFDKEISLESVKRAPLLVFNRKDELQSTLLQKVFNAPLPDDTPIHYLPSSEKFMEFIAAGMAYGMVPDIQSKKLLEKGVLIDILPLANVKVPLYWHCWNIKSSLMETFSKALVSGASKVLEP
ncbi:IciA [Desulfamplus magnetovallimortis]|uniref:IciA n=1 Tax=Desulfamplus magnetovallimortis TaxID=1246637 RepID=A0A1W1HHN4_9BACT|nr:LysR family transcriptional regulator ArgP [Desulfamplus magnetovallimortis]SLM31943.1 IciA [Desulfamplus magnetovallimortis]